MAYKFYLFVIFLIGFAGNRIFCQTVTLPIGSIKGNVWDSANSTILASATLAIYQAKDTSLVTYTMSDKNGTFSLQHLPVGVALKLVISFTGYKSIVKSLQLLPSDPKLEIGRLNLSPAANLLEEVTVTGVVPPVSMKGDTLEFHADAFKLDPNAQAEDLLRLLPGITIWGDGAITVNGREVSSVLVNGKPFFGTDARVTTQNIPENIIDQVQVYQKDKGTAQRDSVTEINIKLKKGKDAGYFGKVSGAYGTRHYHETNGSLNFFNKRTQFSVAVVSNNVNKIADGMSFLLANQTFKGTGANVEYQSNFSMPGLSRYKAGGLFFQHDFINPTYQNIDRLTGEYYVDNNKQYLFNNTQTITTVNDSSYFMQEDKNESHSSQLNQHVSFIYQKKMNGNSFNLSTLLNSQSEDEQRLNSSAISNKEHTHLSLSTQSDSAGITASNVNIRANFAHAPNEKQTNQPLSNYTIDYNLSSSTDSKDEDLKSIYFSASDPGLNRDLARLYNDHSTRQDHQLHLAVPGFISGLIKKSTFPSINIGLKNQLQISKTTKNDLVKDKDTALDKYNINTYLSNKRQEESYNVKPAITISKTLHNKAPMAGSKELSAEFLIGPQFFSLRSSSQKKFQQFSRDYKKLVGEATLTFQSFRMNAFMNTIRLEAKAHSQYPTVEQLAPLIDSANLNYIQTGNFFLKEQDTREVNLLYTHSSLRPQNTLTYNFSVSWGYVNNYIANSNHIDSVGRVVNTLINSDGYRYSRLDGQLKKSYKINKNQLQLIISQTTSLNKTPIYINGKLNYFSNIFLSYDPSIQYTYGDRLVINVGNKHTYSWYKQKGPNSIDITNSIKQIELSFYLNCTKKLSIGSNIENTRNVFNKMKEINFTIWNASVAYRMSNNNNAELKFSALDLLRQNTGLINYGSNNSVTQGRSNVLQQYFMLTLSWYPRKFGK